MQVSCACPKMAIKRINGKLRRADAEPITVTITRDDLTTAEFVATIPETDVDLIRGSLFERLTKTHWRVQKCAASTKAGAAFSFLLKLPPEDVTIQLIEEDGRDEFAAMAQPIDCEAKFIDSEGSRWEGVVHFDECEADFVSLTTSIAEPIVATSTLTRVA